MCNFSFNDHKLFPFDPFCFALHILSKSLHSSFSLQAFLYFVRIKCSTRRHVFPSVCQGFRVLVEFISCIYFLLCSSPFHLQRLILVVNAKFRLGNILNEFACSTHFVVVVAPMCVLFLFYSFFARFLCVLSFLSSSFSLKCVSFCLFVSSIENDW